ncbi:serine/threonine-protein kinase HipA [Raineyella antarctica]|uniref:Serine/threonine-protein kinase HipA n=1 Tax=Raineyella antarctica TaxID=1577474 RepID=A0A1G6HH03_9ACTN|nr:HipA domain-containing protein [Raineyella antarctica]SDB93530.1 serine/threonine-protein kinase HipA [Raineyella antarctica]
MSVDLRTVRHAEVYKAGRPAATLTRGDGTVTFTYLPEYAGPPVARTLPVGRSVTTYGGSLPPFFAGLLPEGRRLTAVRRAAKTSADDDLTLLLVVGSDTVGDVTVFPEGADPSPAAPAVASTDLASLRFADLVAEAGFVDRRAVPGVQDKLSASRITLPVRFAGIDAIIKLDTPDHPLAVANESYFLDVARRLRQQVVESEVIRDRDGRPGLLVRRFDRPRGTVSKLAVEDATQLLDRYPADKYAVTGEETAIAVAQACAARPVAARGMFQQFALAWLVGNGDLHAKNVSVVQLPSGEWRVAPIYDVSSTLPYGDPAMALSLQGSIEGLTRCHFLGFGAALGLPPRAVESALAEVLEATESVPDDLQAGAVLWPPGVRQALAGELLRRRHDLEA